ncbi:MAG: Maf family protein [Phycisphaeraceae bacterium]|nr:Maf family protein [Phycisphaerae bacterium]MBX3393276.1 Maf family protein [Phycisphaeraceae bacterium]
MRHGDRHNPIGGHDAVALGTTDGARRFGRVLLASRSPRRRELLDSHGYDFEARHPGIDDSVLSPGRNPPPNWVTSLAHLKALAGLEYLRESGRVGEFAFVIGADTTCVLDGQVIGTPDRVQHAEHILRSFRANSHAVVTGVSIIRTADGSRTLFADQALVTWGDVSDRDIREYLDSGLWRGKAGAYNLDDRISARWPITFDGDAATITGLPMGMLARVLSRLTSPDTASPASTPAA